MSYMILNMETSTLFTETRHGRNCIRCFSSREEAIKWLESDCGTGLIATIVAYDDSSIEELELRALIKAVKHERVYPS